MPAYDVALIAERITCNDGDITVHYSKTHNGSKTETFSGNDLITLATEILMGRLIIDRAEGLAGKRVIKYFKEAPQNLIDYTNAASKFLQDRKSDQLFDEATDKAMIVVYDIIDVLQHNYIFVK